MCQKNTQKTMIRSKLLQTVPSLLHGFSTRAMGDMKKDLQARKDFLDAVGIEGNVAIPEQIHGTVVSDALEPKGSDGLVGRIPMGIITADCVPILAVDPQSRVVAAVHAGWRGTLGNIAKNMLDRMKDIEANVSGVLAWIGPHIGMCCYGVDQDRAKRFIDVLGEDPKTASFFEHAWHLDLGYVNYRQLVTSGVKPEHIDFALTCTSCQHDEFFSFRKDTKETFGEMMGVIGWK